MKRLFWMVAMVITLTSWGCATRVEMELVENPGAKQVAKADQPKPRAPVAVPAQQAASKSTAGAGSASSNVAATPESAVANVQADEADDKNHLAGDLSRVIFFDYDSFTVKSSYIDLLRKHAQIARKNPKVRLMIEGHTDSRGGVEYNLGLGQKRAESVARVLRQAGAPEQMVEPVSYGKEKPEIEGTTEESFAKNRRVIINYR